MTQTDFDMFSAQGRGNWVRLRTLVILRWFAVGGQIIALFVATQIFGLQLAIGPAAMTVGASVVGNLFAMFLYAESKRLTVIEATMMLVFDILQLALLLYLTGGLNNPFALLLLAPVTIGATILPFRPATFLAVLAILAVSLLARFHITLLAPDGMPLVLPSLFLFGSWVALLIGVLFQALYTRKITTETNAMRDALMASQMALAREQKLTDLGGVVAAAAHELGTPLATIKLVSSELMDELAGQPDLLEDVTLIREQAERCGNIMRSMGRAGKDDLHLRRAPLETVVKEAAEPHMNRGKDVRYVLVPATGKEHLQPQIYRRPEIIHGLRNLVQNAVDFARTTVRIELIWSENSIVVRISDDGEGFPSSVIGRIGDPFVRQRRRREDRTSRPGYEGMGLGLFIAKTLLERSGAVLSFANGGGRMLSGSPGGAIVVVEWPRAAIDAGLAQDSAGLGQNAQITS